jgi:hypothetical protein
MNKEHNGHKYNVIYCDPDHAWHNDHVGMFYIDMAITSEESDMYFDTYKQAEIAAKKAIDDFVISVPTTESEWIDAVSKCVVRDGYESFYIDRDIALDLLRKAARYFEHQSKEKTK